MADTHPVLQKVQGYLGKILEWQIPELAQDSNGTSWQAKLATLAESKLERQHAMAVNELRVQQAETLFEEISNAEAVEILMGEPHSETQEESDRKNHTFTFCHLEGKEVVPGWGTNKPTLYLKKSKEGGWFTSPFKLVEKWRVTQQYDLDKISVSMPHKVVEALNHLRKIRFFNGFRALESSDGQVLILGELWDMLPVDGQPAKNSGSETYFIIAYYEETN